MTSVTSLLLALSIGLLIGLERGWRQRSEHEGGRIAGVRTFALLGLGGGLAGLAASSVSVWLAVVGLGAMAIALLLAHRARLNEPDDNVSATNVIVGILTMMIGLAATTGYPREAMIAGGLAALLLSMREQLHGWLRTLSERDIRAVAQYGAITLVMLPLLPDRAMGPYGALNPRMLWLVVVFVTGLSFAGYWASKKFGHTRGTIIAAAIGATYSSTAVTMELARRIREPDADQPTLRAAIAAATAIMPLRVILLCAVILPGGIPGLLSGIGAALLFALAYALAAISRADRQSKDGGLVPDRNPFDFWPAVGFAVLVAAVILLSHWTIDRIGDRGADIVIGVTGFYDVDAAIIAAASMPDGTLNWNSIGMLLSLPVLANNLLKMVLVLVLGKGKAGIVAALPLFVASVLIGLAMFWLA